MLDKTPLDSSRLKNSSPSRSIVRRYLWLVFPSGRTRATSGMNASCIATNTSRDSIECQGVRHQVAVRSLASLHELAAAVHSLATSSPSW